MTRTAIIAMAAMLAGGMGIAAAQTSSTTSTPSATVTQGKCWDAATNQVRDKTTTQMGSSSTTTTTPSTTTGSGSSSSSDRPAAAAGLPDCK